MNAEEDLKKKINIVQDKLEEKWNKNIIIINRISKIFFS